MIIVSNCESVEPLCMVQRYSASEKKSSSIPQPQIIKAYNYNMGGTDRQDQNVSYYRTSIRSKNGGGLFFMEFGRHYTKFVAPIQAI